MISATNNPQVAEIQTANANNATMEPPKTGNVNDKSVDMMPTSNRVAAMVAKINQNEQFLNNLSKSSITYSEKPNHKSVTFNNNVDSKKIDNTPIYAQIDKSAKMKKPEKTEINANNGAPIYAQIDKSAKTKKPEKTEINANNGLPTPPTQESNKGGIIGKLSENDGYASIQGEIPSNDKTKDDFHTNNKPQVPKKSEELLRKIRDSKLDNPTEPTYATLEEINAANSIELAEEVTESIYATIEEINAANSIELAEEVTESIYATIEEINAANSIELAEEAIQLDQVTFDLNETKMNDSFASTKPLPKEPVSQGTGNFVMNFVNNAVTAFTDFLSSLRGLFK